MIVCKELNKCFSTKEEMFKALLANQDKIIGLKRAEIHKSEEKGQLGSFEYKAASADKADFMKEGYIYPVINTTKYMDSHGDVHFNGIWNKSVKEQQGSIYYVADHSLKTSDVIAWPEDVKAFVKEVPWTFVGKNYEGTTEALIYEIKESALDNEKAKSAIEKRRPVQNSVRMQYVKIRLAIDSTDKEFAENKALFDSEIESIANKEYAREQGYFWAVEEAKIVKEGSMVLAGSNDATPIRYTEAADSTSEKKEPSNDTQTEECKKMLNDLISRI